jgi:hypothetical protein
MKNFESHFTKLFFTKHAKVRMQQRSFSPADIASIIHSGTFISDNEVLLTRKDTEREVSVLRERIKAVERQKSKMRISDFRKRLSKSENRKPSEAAYLRQQIKVIERLTDRKVVISGNSVITCYPCSKSELKRISKIIN